ncbi:protein kinase [Streptomyces sp. MBT56]|uniref:protein kinase domain-containing protein n=1 Tax=unclassified Streptomyces TaxID=2593676 RepID=UPI00190C949D|nr:MULTISPECIES: protein kinase [unclassified Streptomyces]MBK3555947.1 protein kinase [Streptomyces sp. MBT56]MBK3605178.1 protein kinase [Streptomyces sp. MBT54]MBK3618043.1 protein kinase [Streptomyces sp. MBT98]
MSGSVPELPIVVLDTLMPTAQRLVVDRRGSTVWEVKSDRGHYAVKIGHPIDGTADRPAQPWTALAPAREGAVLHRLGLDDLAYGQWERGTWNLQPWHEGPDLYRLWEPCRKKDSPAEPPTRAALGCAEALAELHAKGWAHGDVQPAHFIIGPERTHLIDLALARGGHVPEEYDFPFRGCLVHYEAPEIARSVLATGEAEPTPQADIYALGASLLISATGWRAVEYPDDAPRPAQRRAVASGKRRPVRAPGQLGDLIDTMLSPAPGDRPTIQEVREALR